MRVVVTGGTGMVGSAFRNIQKDTTHELILIGSKEADLTSYEKTYRMLKQKKPDAVIHLAAKVGGVKGNTDFVADFFSVNVLINTNLLNACNALGISKVVSLLSTCVYPDTVSYPLTEDQIHNGEPHHSNFGYAYAKRMLDVHSRALRAQYGRNYVCAVPNNLYGLHDNFDLENGHVIPAIIRKVWEAKLSGKPPTFWGDGSPLREFTFADDIAKALIFLLEKYDGPEPVNIGSVGENNISSVVQMVCDELNYKEDVIWDLAMPKGQYKKPSDNSNFLSLGWKQSDYTPLEQGLKKTVKWFVDTYPNVRGLNL